MDIQAINTAIIAGNFTSSELDSIVDAVKFARTDLAYQAKRTLRLGTNVKWYSPKRAQYMTGKVSKIAVKYATVDTAIGMWKVPLAMLEVA